jgi:hypothetical protein
MCPVQSVIPLSASLKRLVYEDPIPNVAGAGPLTPYTGHAEDVIRLTTILAILVGCISFCLVVFYCLLCCPGLSQWGVWRKFRSADWLFTHQHDNEFDEYVAYKQPVHESRCWKWKKEPPSESKIEKSRLDCADYNSRQEDKVRGTVKNISKDGSVVFSRRTTMGGLCTMLTLCIGGLLFIVLCLTFGIDNVVEVQSVVPSALNARTVSTDMSVRTRAIFWTPHSNGSPIDQTRPNAMACVLPQTVDQCVPSVTVGVSPDEMLIADPSYSCSTAMLDPLSPDGRALSYCQVTISWRNVQMLSTRPRLNVSFGGDDSYALSVAYDVSFTAAFPDQFSSVQSHSSPPQGELMKGMQFPWQIPLTLTRARWEESWDSSTVRTGFVVSSSSVDLATESGSSLGVDDFHSDIGVLMMYTFQIASDTLIISRSQQQTWVQFISLVLGS